MQTDKITGYTQNKMFILHKSLISETGKYRKSKNKPIRLPCGWLCLQKKVDIGGIFLYNKDVAAMQPWKHQATKHEFALLPRRKA